MLSFKSRPAVTIDAYRDFGPAHSSYLRERLLARRARKGYWLTAFLAYPLHGVVLRIPPGITAFAYAAFPIVTLTSDHATLAALAALPVMILIAGAGANAALASIPSCPSSRVAPHLVQRHPCQLCQRFYIKSSWVLSFISFDLSTV